MPFYWFLRFNHFLSFIYTLYYIILFNIKQYNLIFNNIIFFSFFFFSFFLFFFLSFFFLFYSFFLFFVNLFLIYKVRNRISRREKISPRNSGKNPPVNVSGEMSLYSTCAEYKLTPPNGVQHARGNTSMLLLGYRSKNGSMEESNISARLFGFNRLRLNDFSPF